MHPICLHIELKHKIRADDSGARVGAKLKIAHVHATARTPQRPSIVLSPGKYSSSLSVYTDSFACHTCDMYIYTTGMNVLLNSDEVVLYLASQGEGDDTYVWVLSYEPYAGPPAKPPISHSRSKAKMPANPSQQRPGMRSYLSSSTSSTTRSTSSTSCSRRTASTEPSSVPSFEHPIAKLPWFKRRPVTEIRKVRANKVLMRLRVVPAFFLHEDGGVDNDGYLLSHGLYNFDLRKLNEETVVTVV